MTVSKKQHLSQGTHSQGFWGGCYDSDRIYLYSCPYPDREPGENHDMHHDIVGNIVPNERASRDGIQGSNERAIPCAVVAVVMPEKAVVDWSVRGPCGRKGTFCRPSLSDFEC